MSNWLKMLLLLNCISNCSSRMALKTWNMFRKFDKFCLFSPVREKWILKRKIRIWLLLQMFPGWRKMFGGGKYTLWLHDSCLFVCFIFFWNWMKISLMILLVFPKVLHTVLPFSWIIHYFWLHIFNLSTQCLHIMYSMY